MSYLAAEYARAKRSAFPAALQRFFSKHLTPKAGQRVIVDVGSGTGDFLAAWWPVTRAHCIAVDREYGLRTENCYLTFSSFNFEKVMPYDRGIADLVLCKSVIEHARDPVAFVKLIALFAKNDGKVILMAPDFETCWLDFYDDPTHVSPTTLKGLEQAVRIAGFEIIESGKVTQTPWLLEHPRIASLLRAILPKQLSLLAYRRWGIDWPRRASQAACYVVFGGKPCQTGITPTA